MAEFYRKKKKYAICVQAKMLMLTIKMLKL